jgi:hypothetical protein
VNLLICDVAVVFILYLTGSVIGQSVSYVPQLKTVCAAGGENEVKKSVALWAIFKFLSVLPSISKYKYYFSLL